MLLKSHIFHLFNIKLNLFKNWFSEVTGQVVGLPFIFEKILVAVRSLQTSHNY
jgi:hypothetical protein